MNIFGNVLFVVPLDYVFNVNETYLCVMGPGNNTYSRMSIGLFLIISFCLFGLVILQQISILLCLFGEKGNMCAKAEYAASRIVNINVAINPFLYAIMKPSYRRGYWSLLKQGIKFLSFGLLNEKTMEGKASIT